MLEYNQCVNNETIVSWNLFQEDLLCHSRKNIKKLTTADEAVKVVKSGDRLEYGWCVTTPVALDEALAKRMPDLENIQIHGGIVMRPLAITQIETQQIILHGIHGIWVVQKENGSTKDSLSTLRSVILNYQAITVIVFQEQTLL